MYTYCTIQFVDDQTTCEAIIKEDDNLDKYDELIFFYGYSKEQLEDACRTGEVLEDEWRVLSVDGEADELY